MIVNTSFTSDSVIFTGLLLYVILPAKAVVEALLPKSLLEKFILLNNNPLVHLD